MISRTMKRAGLVAAAALALCVLTSAASASAATQHWADASQVPYGNSQSFTGKATGNFRLDLELSTSYSTVNCQSLSTSGSVENPVSGGPGGVNIESFELGECKTDIATCVLKGAAVRFEPMRGEAYESSGEDLVEYQPAHGSVIGEMNFENAPGSTCSFFRHVEIEGAFSPHAVPGHPGEYMIEDSNLSWASGEPLTMAGSFSLSTPGKQALVLSSGASPGAPHWYLGNAEWVDLAKGSSTTLASLGGSMSFEVDGEAFGVPMEIACSASGGSLNGSVENPISGGAGSTSAVATFAGCQLSFNHKPYPKCQLRPSVESAPLVGTATEQAGVPAIELTPAKGTQIAGFYVEGAECSGLNGYTLRLFGKLLAISEGAGSFAFAAPGEGLVFEEEIATASGGVRLQTAAGNPLRLQP